MTAPDRLHIRPVREGMTIRDPRTKRKLPDAGARMPASSYWYRRLRDGDVVPVVEASEVNPDPVAEVVDAAPIEPIKKNTGKAAKAEEE